MASSVDLNKLNPKQLLKEYKSTQKDLKSKDGAVKLAAITKFSDTRYLLEGGCFIPFVVSFAPKKVSPMS